MIHLGKLCYISLTGILRPAMGMISLKQNMLFLGFGRTGFGRDEIYPDKTILSYKVVPHS